MFWPQKKMFRGKCNFPHFSLFSPFSLLLEKKIRECSFTFFPLSFFCDENLSPKKMESSFDKINFGDFLRRSAEENKKYRSFRRLRSKWPELTLKCCWSCQDSIRMAALKFFLNGKKVQFCIKTITAACNLLELKDSSNWWT